MSDSLLQTLLQALPTIGSQKFFQSSFTAISHAMEDLILLGDERPLVIANFQCEQFYRQEFRRYQRISQRTEQVYVLASPDPESSLAVDNEGYDIVPLNPNDALARERHLVIIGKRYTACLVGKEQSRSASSAIQPQRFDGFWTFDPHASTYAARWLLERIKAYRPELTSKIEHAQQQYSLQDNSAVQRLISRKQEIDIEVFGQRLITYLQAGQHKLSKAYQKIAVQEERERLLNNITVAIRNSLDSELILNTAVQSLGSLFPTCRCLLYRCRSTDSAQTIDYEFVGQQGISLKGKTWPLTNPLIQVAMAQERALVIADTANASSLQQHLNLLDSIQRHQIHAWLLVPIRYQGTLVGMIELHATETPPHIWQEHDVLLIEAIATQTGFALTQAEAYTDLETLNRQLAAVEQTQQNLIAIVGHELRTPLSTIQVCLESIFTEPDMPAEFQRTMLDIALSDAERMRNLIQNFLTLSRLETGTSMLCVESIQIREMITLAINRVKPGLSQNSSPRIKVELPSELPSVKADGESFGKVLTELLENACKFTEPDGEITVYAYVLGDLKVLKTVAQPIGQGPMIEIVVTDTGRGIELDQLEAIFDCFAQEEEFMRRTVNGAGLGLAICRQLVQRMGGRIWATSQGKNKGSQFHFTLPIDYYAQ